MFRPVPPKAAAAHSVDAGPSVSASPDVGGIVDGQLGQVGQQVGEIGQVGQGGIGQTTSLSVKNDKQSMISKMMADKCDDLSYCSPERKLISVHTSLLVLV